MTSTTTYESDDTALLIVDPYNDFMSKGGKYYERTKETAESVGFYDNMRKLIPAVREARIQVVIVPHHRWRESDYKGWKHINPSQVHANQAQGFAAGTWGGEFNPEFGPHDGDVVALGTKRLRQYRSRLTTQAKGHPENHPSRDGSKHLHRKYRSLWYGTWLPYYSY